MAKEKKGRTFWAVLLMNLLLVALLGSIGSAADPEPVWESIPESNFDAGPGWPTGWAPPTAPAGISAEVQAEYKAILEMLPADGQPSRLLMQVQPEPKWAKEYPFYWKHNFTGCGSTAYLYYYRYPDTNLLVSEFGDYGVTEGSSGSGEGGCGFNQVVGIDKPTPPDPRVVEHDRLVGLMQQDIRAAQAGLADCPFWTENHPGSIAVCYNEGDASKLFDRTAPAYLDTEVSRVRVPVRFLSELMGAEVTWNEATRQVTIDFPAIDREIVKLYSAEGYTTDDWWVPETRQMVDDHTVMKPTMISQPARRIVLTIGERTAYVDGNAVPIDAPPVILPPGRTMVPLRFVSEQLGAKVYWVGRDPIFPAFGGLMGTYQVHIYTPFHPFFDSPSWLLEHRAVKS